MLFTSISIIWYEEILGTTDFCQAGEKNTFRWQSPLAQVPFSVFRVSKRLSNLFSIIHINFAQQLSSFTPTQGGLSLGRQSNQPLNINQVKVSVCIITSRPLVLGQKIQLSGNLAALLKVSDTPLNC